MTDESTTAEPAAPAAGVGSAGPASVPPAPGAEPTGGPSDAKQTPDEVGVLYVVQQLGYHDGGEWVVAPDGESDVWTDIATVTVPKRTQGRTILLRAIAVTGMKPEEVLEDGFRLLDEEAGTVRRLRVKEPREPDFELI